jgi:hypothetical protein
MLPVIEFAAREIAEPTASKPSATDAKEFLIAACALFSCGASIANAEPVPTKRQVTSTPVPITRIRRARLMWAWNRGLSSRWGGIYQNLPAFARERERERESNQGDAKMYA